MKQLVQPNLAVKGSVGYCLEYAEDAFNTSHDPNDWARRQWDLAKFRHPGELPPDAAVPLWYSYTATIDGITRDWGHVTIWVPGKGIYSSPWQLGTDHAVLSSISEVERIYGVRYLGWSEDIANVKVVGDDVMNQNQLSELHWLVMGSAPGPDYLSVFDGQTFDAALNQLKADPNRLQITGLMDPDKLERLHRLAMGSQAGPSYIEAFNGAKIDPAMAQLENDPNRLNARTSTGGGYTEADRATATETNTIVKNIWAKISNIFK